MTLLSIIETRSSISFDVTLIPILMTQLNLQCIPTDYLFPKDIVLTKATYEKAVLEATFHLLSIFFISNRSHKPAQEYRSL